MTTEQVDARPLLASALVTALDHVGIAVPDLDAAKKWYHDQLGMIVLHEEVNDEQGVREAMLAVRGAPTGSTQLQLIAPIDESSTIAKFIDKRGPGLQQLAYRVSDIDALTERLSDQGVRLLYDAPGVAPPTRGSTSSTPKTPAGCSSNWSNRPPSSTDERQGITAPLGPAPGRPAAAAVGPAPGVPVPSFIKAHADALGRPGDQVRGARRDLMVAAGTPIGLLRACRGHRTHDVRVSVGAGLDALR